jgi:hypothetical protein
MGTDNLRYIAILLTLCVANAGLSGCAIVPNAAAPDPNLVPDIPQGATVTLLNGQTSDQTVPIGSLAFYGQQEGNLHVWTDDVISVMKSTLEQKNVKVNENSAKSLKISITKAELKDWGGVAFDCDVTFDVTLGNGTVLTLDGDDHGWKFVYACDGAVTAAALKVLTDNRILHYLAAP